MAKSWILRLPERAEVDEFWEESTKDLAVFSCCKPGRATKVGELYLKTYVMLVSEAQLHISSTCRDVDA